MMTISILVHSWRTLKYTKDALCGMLKIKAMKKSKLLNQLISERALNKNKSGTLMNTYEFSYLKICTYTQLTLVHTFIYVRMRQAGNYYLLITDMYLLTSTLIALLAKAPKIQQTKTRYILSSWSLLSIYACLLQTELHPRIELLIMNLCEREIKREIDAKEKSSTYRICSLNIPLCFLLINRI